MSGETNILIDGSSHKIGIFEIDDDWVPFKRFTGGSQEDLEENEDEEKGISDAFEDDEMQLQDGEIAPEEASVEVMVPG